MRMAILLLAGMLCHGACAQATALTNGPAAAQPSGPSRFEAYSLVLGNPEEALPLLREIAGPEARLSYMRDTGRLLVYGPPAAHEAIRGAMQELSRPRRNVRIGVAFAGEGVESGAGVSVQGGGTVVITPGGTAYQAVIQPQAGASQSTQSSLTQQQILTQSGSEAVLAVGTEVPFVESLLSWGRRWGYVTQVTEMRNVGAFLRVRPTVVDDGPLVHVVVTPELSGLVDGRPEQIRYARAATEVTVADGQTLTIGAHGEHAEFFRLFLAGLSRTRQTGNMQITLTVRLE